VIVIVIVNYILPLQRGISLTSFLGDNRL